MDKMQRLEMIAHEAFIRRAARLDYDFLLKGSYVGRQYFPDPSKRHPADVDWVYLSRLSTPEEAEKVFSNWMIAVTEMDLEDGVRFRSFTENRFWRMIDYAMADDFPTVNTDLLCWVGEKQIDIGVDISFNLGIEHQPVPMNYRPINGSAFELARTVPLNLQVSWKVHQTIVRPRFKDLFDLMHFVQHREYSKEVHQEALQALVDECYVDKISNEKVSQFFNYEWEDLFAPYDIEATWCSWRGVERTSSIKMGSAGVLYNGDQARWVTNPDDLTTDLWVFLTEFQNKMQAAGWNEDAFTTLPSVSDTTLKRFPFSSTDFQVKESPISESEMKAEGQSDEDSQASRTERSKKNFWSRIFGGN